MNRRTAATQPAPVYEQAPAPVYEPAAAPAPAPTAAPSYVAELEQLASLRDAGVLTGEEFAAKKSQILGL